MQLEILKKQIIEERGLYWYNRAYLISMFHHIKQYQLGIARNGPGNKGWSYRDTARELKMSLASVHNYLKLASAIVDNVELKKLSLKKALKKV